MKREYLHIRPDINHLERIDDKHTFFGVLNRYYAYEITDGKKGRIDGISKNWNAESTLKNNKNDYENVIFPQIPEKALEDMTKEDFDEIIKNSISSVCGDFQGYAYDCSGYDCLLRT